MIQLEEVKFYTLLKFFFSEFFCDDLEKAIDNDEISVVTLFRGMDFFFELIKEYNIDFPYSTIREYVTQTYSEGDVIYTKLSEKYDKEINNYYQREKTFEEIYGNIDFL